MPPRARPQIRPIRHPAAYRQGMEGIWLNGLVVGNLKVANYLCTASLIQLHVPLNRTAILPLNPSLPLHILQVREHFQQRELMVNRRKLLLP